MTVFKGYLTLVRRNIGQMILYLVIFVSVTMLIQNNYMAAGITEGFTSVKTKAAVIDREGGAFGRALKSLLGREQELVELPDDQAAMQEALYYGDVEYILVVPEGAGEGLAEGGGQVQSITAPGTLTASYVDAQVDSFLNEARVYLAAGYPQEEAFERALLLGEQKGTVTMQNRNGNQGLREGYNSYFGFLPYGFLASVIMSMGCVLTETKKREVRRRLACSSVPFARQNLAAISSFALLGAVVWAIYVAIQGVMYGGGVFRSAHCGLYLLNSACCMAVALGLGYLCGMIANRPSALSGVCNVVSLGLCFLGGVFVPLEIMGEKVKQVAQFLPTYWYSRINGILGDYGALSSAMRQTVRWGLAIQLAFALACFAVALLIRRAKLQEEG